MNLFMMLEQVVIGCKYQEVNVVRKVLNHYILHIIWNCHSSLKLINFTLQRHSEVIIDILEAL